MVGNQDQVDLFDKDLRPKEVLRAGASSQNSGRYNFGAKGRQLNLTLIGERFEMAVAKYHSLIGRRLIECHVKNLRIRAVSGEGAIHGPN